MDLSVLGCSMQKLFLLAAAQLKAEMLCDDLVGVVGGERWEEGGGREAAGGNRCRARDLSPGPSHSSPLSPLRYEQWLQLKWPRS